MSGKYYMRPVVPAEHLDSAARVVVDNIPKGVTEYALFQSLSKHGPVRLHLFVPASPYSSGWAWVSYENTKPVERLSEKADVRIRETEEARAIAEAEAMSEAEAAAKQKAAEAQEGVKRYMSPEEAYLLAELTQLDFEEAEEKQVRPTVTTGRLTEKRPIALKADRIKEGDDSAQESTTEGCASSEQHSDSAAVDSPTIEGCLASSDTDDFAAVTHYPLTSLPTLVARRLQREEPHIPREATARPSMPRRQRNEPFSEDSSADESMSDEE